MKQKKNTGRKLLSFLLSLAMVVGLMPGMSLMALAADDGKYREYAWNEASKTLSYEDKDIPANVTVLANDTAAWTDGGWYIVPEGGVTIIDRITVTGTANLILRDGATLTASKGITVNNGNTINIYAQSGGTGELSAGNNGYTAGIGGGGRYQSGGTINIHGGKVTANGGSYSSGIGGAEQGGNSEVNIYGGEVIARGDNFAAGIGGYSGKSGGTVSIYGGTVNASGNKNGVGIGTGGKEPGNCIVNICGGDVTASGGWQSGIQGTVTIDGGTVTANGGTNDMVDSAYRGSTVIACNGISGTVTINGGTVSATGGNVTGNIDNYGGNIYACNGIGGTVTINGGTVTATGGNHTGMGGNYDGTTVKEKGFGGSLTIGDSMKVLGGDSADPATEIEKNNGDYTRFKYMIVKQGHAHNFTYSASGATITATCDVAGCGLPEVDGKHTATLTIAAPALTTYGSSESAEATITDENNIMDDATVVYKKGDNTLDVAPTDAGTYTASITLGGATANVEYTIAKADPTANAPTGLTATYGQTLADVSLTDKNPTGNTAGTWAWVDSTQSVGNVVSPAATFKANFTPEDSDNYNSVSAVEVTVTVGKADNPATVTGTASVMKGGNTVDLASNVTKNGATGDVSYAISGETNGCSLSDSVLTSGENAGSVTVNVTVAADDNYNASATMPITVTISDKQTQTITASDMTVTYGDTGKKVEATTDGNGAITYSIKDGSADYIAVDADTGAVTIKKVGTATVIVTAAETSTYAQATKEVTVTISEANAVPATVTANSRTYDGTDKPLVNVDDSTLVGGEMQYALGTATEATQPYTTSIPTATDTGTYYVWYKAVGDSNHTDSEVKCLTITISSRSSGGGGSSSGGSGGGGSSASSTPTTPTESYTVPVSSENTVNVTTNISNGTAIVSEITQSDIDKIVDSGNNNSGDGDKTESSENTSITIDVSQAKSEVTSVQLSEKTMEKLTEAVKANNNVESVEIKMTNATVELDGAALSAVSNQAEGNSIKLVVENTQTTKLNAVQQESLKQFVSAKPFQAYFESNGKEIHDFKGGKATVSVKFSPEAGRDAKHYHMYYLPISGAIERYVTRYAEGMLSFVTTHFSDYAIVYDETMENETGKDNETGDGDSETGDGANTDADGTGTGDNSESGNVDAGDESQTDSLSGSTANGKTAYQNALSINKGLKVSQTGNKLNISWGKVSGADRYEVYAAYCGKKFGKNPVKIVTGAGVTTAVIKKLDGKKLNLKKNFKVYVVAYKTVDGKKQKLGKTIVAHVIGRKNATYTNIKAIKLEKSKATIKEGKAWRIKATVVLVDSSKKMLPESHATTFRYASSNKKIATVNKNGKVKAERKGTCYIWIYAKNGYAKKIKVTVQ